MILAMQMTSVPDLESLRWQHRVFVIFAADSAEEKLKVEDGEVDKNAAGFAERDLKVFRVVGDEPDKQRLRDKLRVHGKCFAVVLIGKDGYVKLRKSETLSAEELFRIIDSMPMRKQEVREQRPTKHD